MKIITQYYSHTVTTLLLAFFMLPIFAFAQFGTKGKTNSAFVNDTTQKDSTPKKNIAPNTRRVYPERAFKQDLDLPKVKEDLATFQYWDELDTLKGIANTLGLVGKPYRNSRLGVADRWFSQSAWRNPLTDEPNVYLHNGETQAKYFDTKTPYFRLDFAQGPTRSPKSITMLDLTASMNVTSFWNMTAYYKRRQAESVYGNNTSDNRLVHLNSYFHDYRHRFQSFVNAQFNEFNNLFSGGTFREYGSNDTTAFEKGLEVVNLSAARGRWNTKSVFADQYYHIIQGKDSTQLKQKLSIRGFGQYEYTNYDFIASSLSLSTLQNNWIPVLPSFQDTSSSAKINESAETYRFRFGGEINYAFIWKNYFIIEARGGVHYQNLKYERTDSSYVVNQSSLLQKIQGTVIIPKLIGLRYDVDFHTRPNTLFNPETYWENAFSLSLKGVSLSLHQLLHSQNPSIFQGYYKAGESNSFRPNAQLNNQQLNHIRAQARWEGKSKIWEKGTEKDTLLPHYFYVQPFVSTIAQAIYYDDTMHVKQAAAGNNLTFTGIEMGGRYRIFRKTYIEGNACVQRGTVSDSTDVFFKRYSQHLPQLYGKLSVFYQNKTMYKGIMRTGVDISFNSSYIADGFDPISAQYFPTARAYTIQTYPRIDIYFATKIKRAHIFAKIINVADGLITPGSYTTAFYPVLPRTFSLGVNWLFFD